MRNIRWSWLCCVVLAAGCAPYVNIPPQPGDVAFHDANLKTVQEVALEAIAGMLAERPIEGAYTLVLPRGTSPASYEAAVKRLGEQAQLTVATNQPIVEVRQIRIRADNAQVDIVRPASAYSPRGPGQLLTVHVSYKPFIGWATQRIETWSTPVQITEPAPDYATAPPEPEPEEAEDAPASEEAPAEVPAQDAET